MNNIEHVPAKKLNRQQAFQTLLGGLLNKLPPPPPTKKQVAQFNAMMEQRYREHDHFEIAPEVPVITEVPETPKATENV